MGRHVRGSLFLDYVRMLRARREAEWSPRLPPEDLPYLSERIDPAGWYPMATFERLGLLILELIAGGDLEAVRVWGEATVRTLADRHADVLVERDPRESLMRFHVVRRTLFDFEAATISRLHDSEVRIRIAYGMSAPAEEAACHQTMGFFQGLVELAGGRDVAAHFAERAWEGRESTALVVTWKPPPSSG